MAGKKGGDILLPWKFTFCHTQDKGNPKGIRPEGKDVSTEHQHEEGSDIPAILRPGKEQTDIPLYPTWGRDRHSHCTPT